MALPGESRCADHLAAWKLETARRDNERRGSSSERGYGGSWQKIRDWKLRESPLCEACMREGRPNPAQVVHHKDENQRNNAPENLESMCRDCHERHHGRKK